MKMTCTNRAERIAQAKAKAAAKAAAAVYAPDNPWYKSKKAVFGHLRVLTVQDDPWNYDLY